MQGANGVSQNIQTHGLNIQTHWISASNRFQIIGSRMILRLQLNERQCIIISQPGGGGGGGGSYSMFYLILS